MALGKKTGGRQPGSPNKMTKTLKEMILGALDGVGGQAYLEKQAVANPVAFMSLMSKLVPSDVKVSGDITIQFVDEFAVRAVIEDHRDLVE